MRLTLVVLACALSAAAANVEARATERHYQCTHQNDGTQIAAILDDVFSGDVVTVAGSCWSGETLTVPRGVTLRIVNELVLRNADVHGVLLQNGASVVGTNPDSVLASWQTANYSKALVYIPSGDVDHRYQTSVRNLRLSHSATSTGVSIHLYANGGQVVGVQVSDIHIINGDTGIKLEDANPGNGADFVNNNRFSNIHFAINRVGFAFIGDVHGNSVTASDFQCNAGLSENALSITDGGDSNMVQLMVWDAHLIGNPSGAITIGAGSNTNLIISPISTAQVTDGGTGTTFSGAWTPQ